MKQTLPSLSDLPLLLMASILNLSLATPPPPKSGDVPIVGRAGSWEGVSKA